MKSSHASAIKEAILILLWLCLSFILNSRGARADEYLQYIRVGCIPKFNYFLVETISVDNARYESSLDEHVEGEAATTLSKPEALLKKPFICNLSGTKQASISAYTLSVKIVDYVPGRTDGAGCVLPQFKISIGENGKEIHKFSAFTGPCTPSQRTQLMLMLFD